jgi:hypothetical protein
LLARMLDILEGHDLREGDACCPSVMSLAAPSRERPFDGRAALAWPPFVCVAPSTSRQLDTTRRTDRPTCCYRTAEDPSHRS